MNRFIQQIKLSRFTVISDTLLHGSNPVGASIVYISVGVDTFIYGTIGAGARRAIACPLLLAAMLEWRYCY